MEDDLRHTFDHIFTLPSPEATTWENKMPEKDPSQSVPPATTNVTMNFNAPVGSVAQANASGSQAAARDFVNAPQGADLLQALAAVQHAIEACRAFADRLSKVLGCSVNRATSVRFCRPTGVRLRMPNSSSVASMASNKAPRQ